MSVTLAKIQAPRAVALEVTWYGEKITVRYDESRYTADYADALPGRLQEAKTGRGAWVELLSPVTDWDILDDQGQHLPVTAEVIGVLPTGLLAAMHSAIMDDLLPNRRRAQPSAAGSFQAAK